MFLLVSNSKISDRNAIEHCARSGPKKLTKTYSEGFPKHSTLITYDHWSFSSDMPNLFSMSYFKREKNARHVTSALCAVWTLNTWTCDEVYSLSDTSLKQTPWVGPCLSLLSLLDIYDISTQDGHYKSRYKSAGKIWLYISWGSNRRKVTRKIFGNT